jgi:hypothetical protein
MTMYTVDKGVPLPTGINDKGRPGLYPWDSMEVGDSFFVPGKTRKQFATQASAAGRRLGLKFVVRKDIVGDTLAHQVAGIRVWRAA